VFLTILSLIIVLGVLIFVHELGHFVVAKAVGIQVLRFSLGFGRPLIAWTRGETEYWISWIPLGGYVKMAGLEDEGAVGELEGGKAAVAVDPERAFDKKPLWARMAVILAGVTMNVLFAFVVYVFLVAGIGVPAWATTQVDTVRVAMLPPGTEALATLRRGDQIVKVDGDTMATWDEILSRFVEAEGEARIEVAGRSEPLTVRIPADTVARLRLARALEPLLPARIGFVYPGEPAARAGLRQGDVVVRANGDTVRSWYDVLRALWYSPGKPVELAVLRDDSVINITVTPRSETDPDTMSLRPRPFGFIGAEGNPPQIKQRLPLTTAFRVAGVQTGRQIGLTVGAVKRMVTGQGKLRELGGPIMIAQISGQAVRLGLARFLEIMAMVSVGLAVLNLLPIPVLDGGHAVFLIAEGIRRKPLSPQLRLRLTQVGMLLVLAIMILAISNDVIRNVR
jgi:regulator of sigma E protease